MFKTIIKNPVDNIYVLEDSEFTVNILVPPHGKLIYPVFCEYMNRNLPVVKNIVLYYEWYQCRHDVTIHKVMRWMQAGKEFIDNKDPKLQYGIKYYPCIVRQYKEQYKIFYS